MNACSNPTLPHLPHSTKTTVTKSGLYLVVWEMVPFIINNVWLPFILTLSRQSKIYISDAITPILLLQLVSLILGATLCSQDLQGLLQAMVIGCNLGTAIVTNIP
jgi:hypothetical protein